MLPPMSGWNIIYNLQNTKVLDFTAPLLLHFGGWFVATSLYIKRRTSPAWSHYITFLFILFLLTLIWLLWCFISRFAIKSIWSKLFSCITIMCIIIYSINKTVNLDLKHSPRFRTHLAKLNLTSVQSFSSTRVLVAHVRN